MTQSALPDPDLQAEFYDGTPMKRLLAWIVDMILIVMLSAAIIPFTAFTGIFFFPFLLLVVGFAYRVITIANGSATLGMRLMGIQFRRQDGRLFGMTEAIFHTLGYSVSMAMPMFQVVSIILMLTTSKKQGLTDLVMGSVAINAPVMR